MSSRIDYCNAVLAESLKAITDKLQRVLNAAARVVTETRKYDRGLTDILRKRTSLAQRAAAGQVQARHHDVSLPASLSSAVPVRLLHAGRECRRS